MLLDLPLSCRFYFPPGWRGLFSNEETFKPLGGSVAEQVTPVMSAELILPTVPGDKAQLESSNATGG